MSKKDSKKAEKDLGSKDLGSKDLDSKKSVSKDIDNSLCSKDELLDKLEGIGFITSDQRNDYSSLNNDNLLLLVNKYSVSDDSSKEVLKSDKANDNIDKKSLVRYRKENQKVKALKQLITSHISKMQEELKKLG